MRQESENEPAVDETPTDELTLRSADEKLKQATDPIPERVEELYALLASRTEMESTGNSEASGSRRNHELSRPSRNQYEMVTVVQTNSHRPTRIRRTTTLDNLISYEQEQLEEYDNEPDMTQLMNAITNVPKMIQTNTQKHKLLQTQMPTFKGQKKRSNEFEHFAPETRTSFLE